MGLPTLKKFLCCLPLESGGLIIGWINIVFSVLLLIGMISLMSLATVAFVHGDPNANNGYVGTMIALSILILYYFIVLVASVRLVQGTKQRDHTKMVLFIILMAIGVVLQFIQILTFSGGLFSSIFFACLSAYFFLCIYSLYQQIKTETPARPYV